MIIDQRVNVESLTGVITISSARWRDKRLDLPFLLQVLLKDIMMVSVETTQTAYLLCFHGEGT